MKYIIYFLIILASCQSEKREKITEPLDEQKGTSRNLSLKEYPEDQNQNASSGTFENNDQSENEYSNDQIVVGIEDHEAEVQYYNPNTGTRSTYTLTVEVENGEVVRIKWPNGGWLDGTHFTATELDEEGSASFTSDKGYEYTVTITDFDPQEDPESYDPDAEENSEREQ